MKVTISRSAMTADVADTVTFTLPRSAVNNGDWTVARTKAEIAAADGVRAVYLTWRDNAVTENSSRSLSSINLGGTPSVGTDAIFQDTDAASAGLKPRRSH